MLSSMVKYLLSALILALPAALPAIAQLPSPNSLGVSAGHHIFSTRDPDATNKFWSALGGEPAALGPLKLIKFPGVLFLVRKGEPLGGTEGSTIDAIGFRVRNLKESLQKWEAAGIKLSSAATAKQAWLLGPDGVKVYVTEDKKLATPIACAELRMAVPRPGEAAAWYAKHFGATPVKRGKETLGDIPGAQLVFVQSAPEVAPTKGRAFDRIGLEVQNLEDTVKRLEGSGAKFDGPIRKASNMALSVAVLTDPWGTYIEISQGLAVVK
jgi:catechol 2,3-dioxygenase-like lactoylglutathione lyase family enzyme